MRTPQAVAPHQTEDVSVLVFVTRPEKIDVSEYSQFFYAFCSGCNWMSAPQKSERSAIDRLNAHTIVHEERP